MSIEVVEQADGGGEHFAAPYTIKPHVEIGNSKVTVQQEVGQTVNDVFGGLSNCNLTVMGWGAHEPPPHNTLVVRY
jgi:hypothetical protein